MKDCRRSGVNITRRTVDEGVALVVEQLREMEIGQARDDPSAPREKGKIEFLCKRG
jgi:hypothetical protein